MTTLSSCEHGGITKCDNAGVTKNVSKMWQDYAKSIGATVDSLTTQQKIQAEVNGIMEETRFQVGDAAKYANTYAGGVASLSKTFLDLKVAIGGIIQPIAQFVIPYIKTAITYITALANVISKYVKGALGQEEEATENMADASDNAAVSVENVGDSVVETAKKTERAMGSFDDLDRLVNKTADDLDAAAGSIDDLTYGEVGGLDTTGLDNGMDTSAMEASLQRIGEFLKPIVDLVLQLKDLLLVLWEATAPLREWIAGIVQGFIEWLVGALKSFTDWARENPETIAIIAEAILGFLAGLWLYNTTMKIVDFIHNLVGALHAFATGAGTAAIGASMAQIAFGLLGAAIVILAANWNKLSVPSKVVGGLGALAIAIAAVAMAVAALQPWMVITLVAGVAAVGTAIAMSWGNIKSELPTADSVNLSPPNIPAYADGAVLPPNKPHLAWLGDQKSGTNLEGPESMFRKIVKEESGGSNEETNSLLRQAIDLLSKKQHLYMNDEIVGDITRGQRQKARMYGQ